MKQAAHTPGPWLVTKTPAGKAKIVDDNGFSIANATSGSYAQQEIDARLIAAAPDLLAALQKVLSAAENGPRREIFADIAREAIAKATGA